MISVTILTKNSVKYLEEVLEALTSFDEILIFDNGSTDGTLAIAEMFPNTTIHRGIFSGFGPTHNHAASLAKNDWILSIDSDEVVTSALVQEIHALSLQRNRVYSFPRHNELNGKWIRWCGWHPDRQYRLYNRTDTRFTDDQVHEAVSLTNQQHIKLHQPLIHYSYSCLEDFLSKMQAYSSLFVEQYRGKKRSSPLKALCHGWFAFFKCYVLKRGFLEGYEGFLISVYNGHTAFYKYLKLYEANCAIPCDAPTKTQETE